MTIDFEALDLVRSSNRSRSYNKKLDDLARENQELARLVEVLVSELPEDKRWSFEERFQKIKKGG